jgi:hypothetical protein
LTDLVREADRERGVVSRVNAGVEIVAGMRDVLQTEDAEQRAELKALGEIAQHQAARRGDSQGGEPPARTRSGRFRERRPGVGDRRVPLWFAGRRSFDLEGAESDEVKPGAASAGARDRHSTSESPRAPRQWGNPGRQVASELVTRISRS